MSTDEQPQSPQLDEAPSQEREHRAGVALTCEVRQGHRPWARIKLHDISESGFRIEWRPGFDQHKPIYIRIPGLEVLSAHLRWKRESFIGGEFSNRLYGPVYEHIVRQSQHEI
jgi:hypothetical protein